MFRYMEKQQTLVFSPQTVPNWSMKRNYSYKTIQNKLTEETNKKYFHIKIHIDTIVYRNLFYSKLFQSETGKIKWSEACTDTSETYGFKLFT